MKTVTHSEADLLRAVRDRRTGKCLIGVDSMPGVGKSRVARRLAAALDTSLVECDLFIKDEKLFYPQILDLESLRRAVRWPLDRGHSVVVDGVLLLAVLEAIGVAPSVNVYVRHAWPRGVLTHSDLFSASRTENELLEPENEIARVAGIPDSSPLLVREAISYHKRHLPHERADVLFESCFQRDAA